MIIWKFGQARNLIIKLSEYGGIIRTRITSANMSGVTRDAGGHDHLKATSGHSPGHR